MCEDNAAVHNLTLHDSLFLWAMSKESAALYTRALPTEHELQRQLTAAG